MDFAVLADHGTKVKENEKKNKYLELAREKKKQLNKKVMLIPPVNGALGTATKRLVQGLEDLEIRGRGDHPNYSIIKIGQNAEESPRDLRRLAVTQTPVKNHQQTLM